MEKIQGFTIFGRQVILAIGANIAMLFLGMLQLPILTKALGASQYGVWSLIITVFSLLTPFTTLAFSMSIVRFLAAEKDANKVREDFFSACLLVLLSGIIFSLVFFFLSGFIATYLLKNASLSSYFKLSSVLLLLYTMFPVLLAFFRMVGKIGIYNLLNVGLMALQVGLVVLFLSSGYGLKGAIWAAIISATTLNIIAVSIIFKQIGFARPRFSRIKVYLKWGIPLTPNSAIAWIISASDRYIVNYFMGVSAAGIYNAADLMGGYAALALSPVSIVLFPRISKSYDEGKLDECRDYFKYSFKYLMMFSIPSAVGLSLLAKPLLRILTTPVFLIGSPLVALAALGALASCLYQTLVYIIYLVGKTQIEIRLLTIAAVLNIMLNIILIPSIGIIGAEVASIIAYTVLGGLSLMVVHKYFKFDLSLTFLTKCALSSGFMALCIWLINPQSVLLVALSILIGIITYFIILICVKGLSKSELAFFIAFIGKSFNTRRSP